jgi:hypothetical protein
MIGRPGRDSARVAEDPKEEAAVVVFDPPYVLEREQWIPGALDETFAFFAEPANLPRITPPWLGLRILSPPPLLMARGLAIEYRVRILGLPTRWCSLIAEYDPPHGFRDVQLAGPTASGTTRIDSPRSAAAPWSTTAWSTRRVSVPSAECCTL